MLIKKYMSNKHFYFKLSYNVMAKPSVHVCLFVVRTMRVRKRWYLQRSFLFESLFFLFSGRVYVSSWWVTPNSTWRKKFQILNNNIYIKLTVREAAWNFQVPNPMLRFLVYVVNNIKHKQFRTCNHLAEPARASGELIFDFLI